MKTSSSNERFIRPQSGKDPMKKGAIMSDSSSLPPLDRFELVADANAEDFRGEWIAIVDKRIVAHNPDMGVVIKAAKKYSEHPEFVRVPKGSIAMY